MIATLSALTFDIPLRLAASNGKSSKSASADSGCDCAPTAWTASVWAAPVMTVTLLPLATRSWAMASRGVMCPIGDSAAMRISAMVVRLSRHPAAGLPHGRHEQNPEGVGRRVSGTDHSRELHGCGVRSRVRPDGGQHRGVVG